MSVLDLLSRVLGLEVGRLVEESAAAREILCCVNLECIASYTNRDTIRDEKTPFKPCFTENAQPIQSHGTGRGLSQCCRCRPVCDQWQPRAAGR